MVQKIYLNGQFLSKEEAKISVYDHGFLYGDGIFEGLRTYNSRIFKLSEHIDRLYKSAKYISLNIPVTKDKLFNIVVKTASLNGYKNSYIRIVVTRGEGDLGLDPNKCKNPSLLVIVDKIELYPEQFYKEGLEVITIATQRNTLGALDPQVKSLNYLNNILAKIEAINAGFIEAIMLNRDGLVIECTGDNIFIVEDGVLKTPPPHIGSLNGITRRTIIDIAKELSIEVKEEVFSRYNLFNANECFLTGTAAEIVPVVTVDGRTIGTGKVGSITTQLREAFRELTEREGIPYLCEK
ncbi:MAG TPA: branched-chain-amino-acid transaminase [Candidatus Omnitrophica bacterium]|nr:branched-chain-amino-acid transaminase [Candidatus Omnitrophota bacterium]